MHKRALLFFVPAVFILILGSCSKPANPKDTVVRLRDGERISFSQMIEELQGVDFVFVGEKHDSMANHRVELQVIEALHARESPIAVGFEMFWAKSQPELDRWISGNMDDEDFIRLYYRDWRMPWPYYRDILYYLKEKRIPMVGLNIPRSVSQKVAAHGAGSLDKEDRAELPPGLSCDVRPGYKDFIQQVFREHAGEKGKSFQNFCEAQVLWDKAMAWHLVKWEKKSPAKTVVLCGLVHALKRGIPARVEEMGKGYVSRVIVPLAEDTDPQAITADLADYLVIPPDRIFPAGLELNQ